MDGSIIAVFQLGTPLLSIILSTTGGRSLLTSLSQHRTSSSTLEQFAMSREAGPFHQEHTAKGLSCLAPYAPNLSSISVGGFPWAQLRSFEIKQVPNTRFVAGGPWLQNLTI